LVNVQLGVLDGIAHTVYMPTSSRKPRLPDPNEMAFGVLQVITGELPPDPPIDPGKNAHAVALGRLGGAKGALLRIAPLIRKSPG
jgi:hypothetical protein